MDLNDIFTKTGDEGDYTILLAESVHDDIYDCISEEDGCLDENANGLSLLDLQDIYTNLENNTQMPYFNLQCNLI